MEGSMHFESEPTKVYVAGDRYAVELANGRVYRISYFRARGFARQELPVEVVNELPKGR